MAVSSSSPSSDAPKAASTYIPGLDGIRTVAFLMVFFRHSVAMTPPFGSTPVSWRSGFTEAGAYGLTIFFVLSAFLITRLLLIERERTGGIDLRAYYVRRTLRIWPLYFLAIFLGGFYDLLRHNFDPGAYLSLSTFTANWWLFAHHDLPARLNPLWSISVEEQFYIVWPLLLSLASRKWVVRICVAMIVLAIVSRVGFVAQLPTAERFWNPSTAHLDSLGYGTLLALAYDRLPRLKDAWWYVVVPACLVLMGIEARWFPHRVPGSTITPMGALAYALISPLATTILAVTLCTRKTLVTHPLMVHLGRITYGMYVFHLAVILLVKPSSPLTFAAALLLNYLVALASYFLFEKRFLALKHRFEHVRSKPA